MDNRGGFRQAVREALAHLYDYERLSRSPLVGWLGAETGYSGKHTLHDIILDAIESLKPERGLAAGTPAWRTYSILFYRFVQCMSVGEVASQLGFGERHLRRHQARAIRLLADLLWERRPEDAAEPRGDELAQQADVNANLAWLESERGLHVADLAEVLAGVEETVARLLQTQEVAFTAELPEGLPRVSIHPLAMRQVLVSVLSYAAGLARGERLAVRAQVVGQEVELQVVCRGMEPGGPASEGQEAGALSVSQRLLEMHGGSLQLARESEGALTVAIRVPVLRRRPVLVIDDNDDTARLYARYLAESRYRPVVARSGREALALAQEVTPCAVVLDVMMPDQDGWEVLGLLKAHPATGGVPVIVATILAERKLAYSLGAADFLHKPVSQAQLLAALDRVVG